MSSLFAADVLGASEDFVALRDEPRNAPLRSLAEDMWITFQPWADPDFPDEFARSVHARFWEMYLGLRLLERGLPMVRKRSAAGPDFHILYPDKHLWIEAVAPGEGEGKDAVPSIFEHDRFQQVPEDKIILRFTNAILTKIERREAYLETGEIGSKDAFVIAVNGHGIGMNLFDGSLPTIVKAVYARGDYAVTIAWNPTDINASKIIRAGYQPRLHIMKASKACVPTDLFLNPDNSGVSGILYSDAALWQLPTRPGSEFLYVDNSVAATRLRADWLGIGRYSFLDGDQFRIVAQPTPS